MCVNLDSGIWAEFYSFFFFYLKRKFGVENIFTISCGTIISVNQKTVLFLHQLHYTNYLYQNIEHYFSIFILIVIF